MQLTLYTDYSLRMLLYLGIVEDATIGEIADAFQVSRNHLVKVAHHLGKAGYIHTTRGRSGGLRLARPAEEISVGDVVRHMEPNFHLVECLNPQHKLCSIVPACKLKDVLVEAHHAFLDVLDKYSVESLLENRELLSALLQPPVTTDPTRNALR